MAQHKPKKHRPRNRPDPARQAVAAQRDEARRQAAEERRRLHEAAAKRTALRKRIRRLAIPIVVGIAVFVVAILVFKPQREIKGVEKVEAVAIIERLGYQMPAETDQASLPAPQCGTVAEPIASPDQLYSDLNNGAVVLWYRTDDSATAATLTELAAGYPSHVVVSPSPSLSNQVVATAWSRWMAFDKSDDPLLKSFVAMYRNRAPGREACPMPAP